MSECQLCDSKDNLVLNHIYLPNIKQIAALHLLQALHEHQWQLSPSVLVQTCSIFCLLSSLISSLVWTERSLKLSLKQKFTHCCFEFVTNWSSLSWLLFLHLIIQLGSCNTIVSFLWWFLVEGHDELELSDIFTIPCWNLSHPAITQTLRAKTLNYLEGIMSHL